MYKIDDNYINTILWCKRGINSKRLHKIKINCECEEYKYLINRYTDSRSLKESVYRIKYNIEEIPKCPICGKFNNFLGGKKGYTEHCCCICTQLDKKVREKNKQTNLKLYGVENGAQSKQAKEKYIKHVQEKYNDNTITNAFQAKEVIEKIKQTCKEKYGVKNYALLPEHQKKLNSIETVLKRENTKKKNGTLNSSIQEDQSYKLLKEKYPDLIRQYRSKLYPFNCDFYIPSLDLYIECQYGQFHHKRPYIGNEQDLKDIEILKERANYIHQKNNVKLSRYDVELETWTLRDVKKRNTAKQNNLNYIEFWNIKELKEWLNK